MRGGLLLSGLLEDLCLYNTGPSVQGMMVPTEGLVIFYQLAIKTVTKRHDHMPI